VPLDSYNLFSWLFPPSDDELLIRDVASLPRQTKVSNGKFISLCDFKEPSVRAAIHLTKYHHNRQAIKLLSEGLESYLFTRAHESLLLIPIPLSKIRRRERGFNQVLEVLKCLSKQNNLDICDSIITRPKHTQPQTTLSRADRILNMQNAFMIKNHKEAEELLVNKHVIIVDDVYTTGATLTAAKASLLPHQPASITCLAFAH